MAPTLSAIWASLATDNVPDAGADKGTDAAAVEGADAAAAGINESADTGTDTSAETGAETAADTAADADAGAGTTAVGNDADSKAGGASCIRKSSIRLRTPRGAGGRTALRRSERAFLSPTRLASSSSKVGVTPCSLSQVDVSMVSEHTDLPTHRRC